jgi:tetratricopeptide (TPR) repeat protein
LLLDVAVPGDETAVEDAHAALADLERYSLITRARDEPTFTVHRLVQDVTRRSLKDDASNVALSEALGWINAAFVADPEDVLNWPVLEPLAPHALRVAEVADRAGIPEPTTRLMNDIGGLLSAKALYAEAEPIYRRALAIDEATFGPEDRSVAISLNNLAILLRDTNRPAEAEPLMRRALAISERIFGPEHPDVATNLNNLAVLLDYTNRLAEAEPLMRRALAIDEASFGPDHPNVAADLNNLAGLLQSANRLEEAEPLRQRVVQIFEHVERETGNLHPNFSAALNNLAVLLKVTNRTHEAEPLYRRSLAIDEVNFGLGHPTVAIRLNNLAKLLEVTNRLGDAEHLSRRHVKIFIDFTRCAGHEHPHLRAAFGNYAGILKAMGKSEAEIEIEIDKLKREVANTAQNG